jgi:hypothetical protein
VSDRWKNTLRSSSDSILHSPTDSKLWMVEVPVWMTTNPTFLAGTVRLLAVAIDAVVSPAMVHLVRCARPILS